MINKGTGFFKNNLFKNAGLAFLGLFLLSACGKSVVYFDPAFTKPQLEVIQNSIKDLANKKIVLSATYQQSFLGKKYQQLFFANGTRSAINSTVNSPFNSSVESGFINYFQKRVSYVMPNSVEVFAPQKVGFLSNVLASNIGPLFWYNQLGSNKSYLGSLEVKMVSPRTGLILLGAETLKKKHVTLELVGTLIHEARHTDCGGAVSEEDLLSYNEGLPMKNYNCGYPHILCPPGSDLDGLFACDAQVWGAYSVQALTMHSLSKACENCDAKEKASAEALFLESLARVEHGAELFEGQGPELETPGVSFDEYKKITAFSSELYNRRLKVIQAKKEKQK